MSDESPWQYVQRRRREGAKDDTLRRELLARGVELTELPLLLDRAIAHEAAPLASTPSSESAWSVLQRMRAEGFSQAQIEADLAR